MLTEKEELELLELENENAQIQEPTVQAEPEKKGLIERGLNYAGKTLIGAFQHPIQTAKGIGYGAAKSIASTATDFAANVNPEDQEDINLTMPGRFNMRAPLPSESSKDIIQRREKLAEQAVTPITENLTPQESRAAKIGEILAPASAGEIALGKPVGAIMKAGTKALGKGMKGFGEKVISIRDKPKKADFDAGYKKENVYKYDLDGQLDNAIQKGQSKIEELSSELKRRIQLGADEGARVNAFDLIDKEIKNVTSKGVEDLDKEATINMLNKFKNEVAMSNPDGVLDLADAQTLKRSIGSKGAWYESKWGKAIDPEANAKEKAASGLYGVIKKEIEQKAPEGIKEINEQLSELIPIENTMLKRLYVAERNSMISLNDMVSLATAAATGPKGWLLFGANKVLNSPITGGGAYRLGEKLTGGRLRPSDIPELKPRSESIPENIEPVTDFDVPTYLRKGRSPLPEQPLETSWKKPVYQETPTSAKMMQFAEDFSKKNPKSAPIEGIDYMTPEDASYMSNQIIEKKSLPITLPIRTGIVISDEMKRDIKKSVGSLTTKKAEDIFNKGSGFVKAMKEQVKTDPNTISNFIDNMTEKERDAFITKFTGKKTTPDQDKLLSSEELANKLVPSSLLTQKELSRLRW